MGSSSILDALLARLSRLPGAGRLWSRFPVGSLETRIHYGIWSRGRYLPYLFGVHRAALEAKALGYQSIVSIEFGVAGGNGLVALEEIGQAVKEATGIHVEVSGFDSGTGMPSPRDYRDLPHVWQEGFYRMDVDALRRRLRPSTKLWLGELGTTVNEFLSSTAAPIGFVSFDLDFYSSTTGALSILAAKKEASLPRVYCYFDDIIWPEFACHSEFTGELLAIREYNAATETRKIAKLHALQWMLGKSARWQEQIYVHHTFDHPLYTTNVMPEGETFRQLPLR